MTALRRSYDLAAVVAVAVLALLLGVLARGSNPLLVAVGLPLVLLAPGYALSAVLVPDRSFGLAERLLLSVGVSIAIAVVGGLLLNLLPGPLDAGLWRTFLAGFTLFVGIYALWRREQGLPAPGPLVTRVSMREASLAAGGALLIGLALGLGAIGISPTSSSAAGGELSSNDRFTQLWATPAQNGAQRVIRVGLRNYEDETMVYRVTLEAGGNVFAEWPQVTIKTGASWQAQAATPANLAGSDVTANAYRANETTPYRHVRIAGAAGGGG